MITLSIISDSSRPEFNLAAEEYFLKNKAEDIHYFYINKPSIIIGKHQNALAEINLPFLEKHNIALFRRLSGGGTVYHDEGNINYCFIKSGETTDLVNFKKATQPIVDVLNHWGVPVRSGQRNDLLVNYKKISGNACHVFKARVMHHGTLLFSSNLSVLTDSLKSNPFRFQDKAVKSVRSQVTNLKDELNPGWNAWEFLENLESSLRLVSPETKVYKLSHEDIDAIEKLSAEKYSTWEWNYGYGPAYAFKKRMQAGEYTFTVHMQVAKGIISDVKVVTNFPDATFSNKLSEIITGVYHERNILLKKISVLLAEFQNLPKAEELTQLFF